MYNKSTKKLNDIDKNYVFDTFVYKWNFKQYTYGYKKGIQKRTLIKIYKKSIRIEVKSGLSTINRYIKKSFLIVVVQSEQNEIHVDNNSYVFEKGSFTIIVAITSAEKEEGSCSIQLSGLPTDNATSFYNNIITKQCVLGMVH